MKIDFCLRFGSGWESALFINCEAANIRLVSVDYSPNASGAELDDEVFSALSYLVNQKLHVIVIVFHTFDFVVSISKAATESYAKVHEKNLLFSYPNEKKFDGMVKLVFSGSCEFTNVAFRVGQ